jgi:parvulin-like peptidyl-prolyl isomerase
MAVVHPSQKPMRLRVRFSYFVLFLLLILGIGGSFFVYEALYKQHRMDGIAGVAFVLPVPIARIGSETVFYRDVLMYRDLLSQFDLALEHVVTQTYIEWLAEDLGVKVDQEDVNLYVEGQDINQMADDLGWTRRQYEMRIVRPLLLAQKVETALYASETYQESARTTIERIERDLALEVAFSDLARLYSQDLSGSEGGYLSYYAEEDALMEELGVFDLPLLEPSAIIERDHSYVIAQLYDVIGEGESRARVGLQWIVIRKIGLNETITQVKEAVPIHYLMTW